jgi:hypothetical protein
MGETQIVHGNIAERKAWILLAIVAGVMILFGFMMMSPADVTAPIGGSPCCTGKVLQEVATTTPWMIDYAGELAKYMGTYTLMSGVLSMVLILIPYRRHERWAWFALLTMPTLLVFHGIVLGSFPFDLGPLIFVVLGLALPVRQFFGTASTVVRTGDRIDA